MLDSNEIKKTESPYQAQSVDDNSSINLADRALTWWSGFSLRTKLLAIATLVVSMLMTGITFLHSTAFKEMQV